MSSDYVHVNVYSLFVFLWVWYVVSAKIKTHWLIHSCFFKCVYERDEVTVTLWLYNNKLNINNPTQFHRRTYSTEFFFLSFVNSCLIFNSWKKTHLQKNETFRRALNLRARLLIINTAIAITSLACVFRRVTSIFLSLSLLHSFSHTKNQTAIRFSLVEFPFRICDDSFNSAATEIYSQIS